MSTEARRILDLEAEVRALRGLVDRAIAASGEFETATKRTLAVLEAWARLSERPPAQVGQLLDELVARPAVDRQAIIAGLVDQIRRDPQLRELLRGPRGMPGVDGGPGPKGDSGATVIREVKISG